MYDQTRHVCVACPYRGRFLLYFITVHFESPRWIEIQRRYLDRNCSEPYEIWASLQGIDASYAARFDRSFDQKGSRNHANKLNHLAAEVCDEADEEDVLVFLDGDAFPIGDLSGLLRDALARVPLVAVQRTENLGDCQPHPCFCATTVGEWIRLRGDWGAAATWEVSDARLGTVTDVGGNLLRRLRATDTDWLPLQRSNAHDLHPMFFGIYGDVIYHHGAGFRAGGNRIDRSLSRGDPVRVPSERLSRFLTDRRYHRRLAERTRRNSEVSWELFRRIESDDPCWVGELRGVART